MRGARAAPADGPRPGKVSGCFPSRFPSRRPIFFPSRFSSSLQSRFPSPPATTVTPASTQPLRLPPAHDDMRVGRGVMLASESSTLHCPSDSDVRAIRTGSHLRAVARIPKDPQGPPGRSPAAPEGSCSESRGAPQDRVGSPALSRLADRDALPGLTRSRPPPGAAGARQEWRLDRARQRIAL